MENTQQNQPEAQEENAPTEQTEQKQAPETPAKPKPQIPLDERILGGLCYVPFLTLLTSPLAVIKKPKSEYCAFHASQGIVLFVLWFASLLVAAFVPPVIGGVIWLVLLFASLFGLFKAFTGDMFKIPGLAAVAVHIPVQKFFGTVKKQAGIPEEGPKPVEAPVEEAPAEAPAEEEKPAVEAPAEAPAEEKPKEEGEEGAEPPPAVAV
ncbi:MAG: hypothetical protein ABH856_00895 [Patescibacteria group bacterium]|nr:hypothetical protein [Patescibacteria group bacterium]